MENVYGLALTLRPELLRNSDELRSAPIDRHSSSMRDRALEGVVLSVSQLLHDLSIIQSCATRVSTAEAFSISATGTYSSAACASAMSPGPKHTAVIPASLRSAASVHALSPSMGEARPSPSRARCSDFTTGAVAGTSLGDCDVINLTDAFMSGCCAATRSQSAVISARTPSFVSPGRVRLSTRRLQRSGYVDIPIPPVIVDA